MKGKILVALIACLFFWGSAKSQIYTPTTPTTYGQHSLRLKADSAQHIPQKDTVRLTSDTSAQLFLRPADSSVWAWYKPRGFFKVSGTGGSGSSVVAQNGLSGTGSTIDFGGTPLNIISGIYVRNNYINGAPATIIELSNRLTKDSLVDSDPATTTLNRPIGATDPTYASPILSIRRNFKEEYDDTLNLQYGGAVATYDRRQYDSTGSIFGPLATKKPIVLNDKGFEATNQIFPPKDSTDIYSDMDGRSSASFSSLWGLGAAWGYNFHVFSTYADYPLAGYNSVIDMQRVASRTRHHGMTGAGVTGYMTSWKHWQAAMDTTTASLGNYLSKLVGYTSYGSTDISLGALGATKAQILARTQVDTSIAFLALPQWRALNEVNNGYGFVAAGDSDYNYMPKLRIAGGIPTKANGGSSDKALEVNGEARFMSTNYYKAAATMTSTNSVNPSSAGLLNFRLVDSTSTMAFGAPFGYGASMGLFGKNVNTSVRGGVDINVPYGGNATFVGENLTAGIRVVFWDNDLATPERRFFMNRRKFYYEGVDSFSAYAPNWKFGGMQRTTSSTWVLAFDSTTQAPKYVRTSDLGIGVATGWDAMLAIGQLQTANRIADQNGFSFGFQGGINYTWVTAGGITTPNTNARIHPSNPYMTTQDPTTSAYGHWELGAGTTYGASYATPSVLISSYSGSGGLIQQAKFWNTGIEFESDSVAIRSNTGVGIIYRKNYGSGFLTRSLVDKGYVDSAILANRISNLGAGFRWYVPASNAVKTLFNGYGTTVDSSSNTNGLTVKVDSTVIADKTAGTNISGRWNFTTTPAFNNLTAGSIVYVGTNKYLQQSNTQWYYDSTNVRVGINAGTSPSARFHLVTTALGSTGTNADGIFVQNTTAAAAGAQQHSPPIVLQGQGWKTNSTAASQSASFKIQLQPIQGAANPTSTLTFAADINAAGYNNRFGMTSAGNFGIGNVTPTYPLDVSTGAVSNAYARFGSAFVIASQPESSATGYGVFARSGGTEVGMYSLTSDIGLYAGGVTNPRFYIVGSTGNVAIGNNTTASARLHIVSTTEQVRTAYDASNYFSTTVTSAGAVTLDAVGASHAFTLNDNTTVNGTFSATDVLSARYTPTLTGVTNVASSSVSSNAFHYIRIGNEVSFSGTITVTPTAGSSVTQIAFSLPAGATSNFAASIDAAGVSTAVGSAYNSGILSGDATNDRIQIEFISSGTSAHTVTVSGHYIII
jgi:hypothetical protein